MAEADALLAVLPRTDCGQCGHAGCEPFARALADGQAPPEACAPAGAYGADRLRRLLGMPRQPARAVLIDPLPRVVVARVDEEDCIGCTKCVDACPVDAILGAPQQMHAVLDTMCTGCGLCLPPCPVDCIALAPPAHGRAPPPSGVADALARAAPEPCTACGACAPVCPEALDPERLFRAVEALDLMSAEVLGISRCTACGKCDPVCPSRIPLVATFVQAAWLATVAAEADARAGASAARIARRARRQGGPMRRPPPEALPDLRNIAGVAAESDIALAVDRARRAAAARRGA
ncbi:MAG: RnfABCDGE type electron transport complex subunit B [Gammaproteobacteria bacterium]